MKKKALKVKIKNVEKKSAHNAIHEIKEALVSKGLLAFDKNNLDANYTSHHKSIQICLEFTLDLLGPSLLKNFITLMLYTGIGGYSPKSTLHLLWKKK